MCLLAAHWVMDFFIFFAKTFCSQQLRETSLQLWSVTWEMWNSVGVSLNEQRKAELNCLAIAKTTALWPTVCDQPMCKSLLSGVPWEKSHELSADRTTANQLRLKLEVSNYSERSPHTVQNTVVYSQRNWHLVARTCYNPPAITDLIQSSLQYLKWPWLVRALQ